jgi:hypothetical protein
MSRRPVVSGFKLVKFLESLGYIYLRQTGSVLIKTPFVFPITIFSCVPNYQAPNMRYKTDTSAHPVFALYYHLVIV